MKTKEIFKKEVYITNDIIGLLLIFCKQSSQRGSYNVQTHSNNSQMNKDDLQVCIDNKMITRHEIKMTDVLAVAEF